MSSSPPLTLYLPRQKRLTLAGSPKEIKATPTIGGSGFKLRILQRFIPQFLPRHPSHAQATGKSHPCPPKIKNCARPSHSMTRRNAFPHLSSAPRHTAKNPFPLSGAHPSRRSISASARHPVELHLATKWKIHERSFIEEISFFLYSGNIRKRNGGSFQCFQKPCPTQSFMSCMTRA